MSFAEAPIHRLSYDDVMAMAAVGVLHEDDKIELLDGVLVDLNPIGADHSAAVARLTRHFVLNSGTGEVRVQDLLRIEGGFVLPDLMVVDPVEPGRHPETARLVVEVAATSQRYDAAKAIRYARAGVDEYWIVDIPAQEVVVHSSPAASGYGEVRRVPSSSPVESKFLAEPMSFCA